MTRLEASKNRIRRSMEKVESQEKTNLVFQETINKLPTYKEQKEFYEFYEKITKEKANA